MWPQEMKITRIGVAIFVKYRELKPSLDGKPNPDSSVREGQSAELLPFVS